MDNPEKSRSGWGATTSGPKRFHPKARPQQEATEVLVGLFAPQEGTDAERDSALSCALREGNVRNELFFIRVYFATLEDMAAFFSGLAQGMRRELGRFFSSKRLAALSKEGPKTLPEAAENAFFSCEAIKRLFSQEAFRRAFVPADLVLLSSDAAARELFTAEVLQRLFLSDTAEALFSERYGRWEGFPKRRTYGSFGAEFKKKFACTSGPEREDAKAAMVLAANGRKFFVDYPNFDAERFVQAIREGAKGLERRI